MTQVGKDIVMHRTVADEKLEEYSMTFIEGQQLVDESGEWIRTEEQLLKKIWYMVRMISSSYDEFYKLTSNKTMLAEEYIKYCIPYIQDDLTGEYHLNALIKTARKQFNCTIDEAIIKSFKYVWKDSLAEEGTYIISDISEGIGMLEIIDGMLVYPERWFSPIVYKKISELLKTFDFERIKYKGRVAYKSYGEFTAENVLETAKQLNGVSLSDKFDFYPTPQIIVDKVQSLAKLDEEYELILEPSAGTGSLIKGLDKDKVVCIELNNVLFTILANKEYKALNIPFEEFEINDYADRIIMNPPFGKRMDAKHIIKAFKEHLKEGGVLVAIHSSGIVTATDKASLEFQELFRRYGTYQEKVDSGAFKDSGKGTMVETYITRLEKI